MTTNATLAHHHDDTVIIPALGQQLCLLGFDMEPQATPMGTYFNAPTVDLDSYSRIIVCMSGKDSIASLLTLIEQGADMSKVDLLLLVATRRDRGRNAQRELVQPAAYRRDANWDHHPGAGHVTNHAGNPSPLPPTECELDHALVQ
jgi:hypothetical protein